MKYNLADLYTSAMESMQRPQQVERVVCYILEEAKKFSANETYSSEEILRDYKNIMQMDEHVIVIPDNSIVTLISQLAKKSDSNIYCLGKKQGYYFSNTSEDSLEESAIDESETTFKEKELYSIFIIMLQPPF